MNGLIVRTAPAGLRNGLPERYGYVYRGTGEDVLTAWMDDPRLRPPCGLPMARGGLCARRAGALRPLQEQASHGNRPGKNRRAVPQVTPAESSMSAVMDLEAALVTSVNPRGKSAQLRRVCGIEDYLFIGGNRMTVPAAAERLGVTERTISRYRAVLRDLAGRAS